MNAATGGVLSYYEPAHGNESDEGGNRQTLVTADTLQHRMDNGIDESAVLAASGDVRLESVRQLVMRGMKLRGFDSVCVVRLRGLTVGI